MTSIDVDCSYSMFWPKIASDIRLSFLDIAPEQHFAGKSTLQAGRRLRLLANCLHNLGALGLDGHAVETVVDAAANVIDSLADEYRDGDRDQLKRIAQFVRGNFEERELLPACAAYVEQELFLLFGPLATWYNKTKECRVSFVMGKPNNDLVKFVTQVVTAEAILDCLQKNGLDGLRLGSGVPNVCFLDLVYCGGESDMFPKHYAYFLPENAGYPRAPRKKTVVFGNVHRHKFDTASSVIGHRFINGFANGFIAESTSEAVTKALSVWIRAHDLGHCVMREGTNWRAFSDVDYFWSMACQEMWADLIACAFMLDPLTIAFVGLTHRSMCDIILAEMIRYASGGFRSAPDAMAAIWELAWMCDSGAIRVNDGVVHLERPKILSAVTSLLATVSSTCLSNQMDDMRRLTSALTPSAELTQLVKAAGEIECLQIYSTSM